jgi:hypothetical protein
VDGPGGTQLRPCDRKSDADALAHFKCVTPSQRYTKAAQRAIRDAAKHLAEGGDQVRVDLAVENSGRIVGAIVYGYDDGHAVIQSLGVVRDRRLEGIGTRLKEGVLAHFVTESGPGIVVFSEVHKNNFPMRKLNKKLHVTEELDPDDRSRFLCAIKLTPDGVES